MSSEPVIVVHGGAGDIPDSRDQAKFDGMLAAVRRAAAAYGATQSVTDACQAAVESMEDDEAFNAGRGSVLNLAGEIEMEALIMEGTRMKAGELCPRRLFARVRSRGPSEDVCPGDGETPRTLLKVPSGF